MLGTPPQTDPCRILGQQHASFQQHSMPDQRSLARENPVGVCVWMCVHVCRCVCGCVWMCVGVCVDVCRCVCGCVWMCVHGKERKSWTSFFLKCDNCDPEIMTCTLPLPPPPQTHALTFLAQFTTSSSLVTTNSAAWSNFLEKLVWGQGRRLSAGCDKAPGGVGRRWLAGEPGVDSCAVIER